MKKKVEVRRTSRNEGSILLLYGNSILTPFLYLLPQWPISPSPSSPYFCYLSFIDSPSSSFHLQSLICQPTYQKLSPNTTRRPSPKSLLYFSSRCSKSLYLLSMNHLAGSPPLTLTADHQHHPRRIPWLSNISVASCL